MNGERRIAYRDSWRDMQKRLFLMGMIVLLAGCGKKGPLIPPEAYVPAAITDLTVAQKGSFFQLCWSPPPKEVSGKPLKNLTGFRIFRRDVLPPAEDCDECPTAYRLLRSVDLEYLQDVRRSGKHYCFADTDLVEGKSYQYKAVSLAKDGVAGQDSNRARRKYLPPSAAPKLKVVSSPFALILEWTSLPLPENSSIAGYNIYRRSVGGPVPVAAINSKPEQGNRFEDLTPEFGFQYLYTVRSVIRVNGELVESNLSNEVAGVLAAPE